jgi:hypothetical protein
MAKYTLCKFCLIDKRYCVSEYGDAMFELNCCTYPLCLIHFSQCIKNSGIECTKCGNPRSLFQNNITHIVIKDYKQIEYDSYQDIQKSSPSNQFMYLFKKWHNSYGRSSFLIPAFIPFNAFKYMSLDTIFPFFNAIKKCLFNGSNFNISGISDALFQFEDRKKKLISINLNICKLSSIKGSTNTKKASIACKCRKLNEIINQITSKPWVAELIDDTSKYIHIPKSKYEMRVDSDGCRYTKQEFIEYYGGTDEWNNVYY